MLTEEEFDQWCSQKRLAQNTRALIAQIRQVPPSRRVQGNYGNVCGNYCSEKMGQTIQFDLCNTLSVQRLQDKASIVVNALHNDIQACKQY